MTNKQKLESALSQLQSSPYQGDIASNSTIKFHKSLSIDGEKIGNVWAIWSGGLQPEFWGNFDEVLSRIEQEVELEKEGL